MNVRLFVQEFSYRLVMPIFFSLSLNILLAMPCNKREVMAMLNTHDIQHKRIALKKTQTAIEAENLSRELTEPNSP